MKKILIIDDSALMRRVMSGIIESELDVCVADTAEDGSVAAKYIKEKRRYDCILLDMNMPKMDGLAFLRFMNEVHCPIPVLVVSSIASKSTKEAICALELGAFDLVKKPDTMSGKAAGDFKEQLLLKVACACRSRFKAYWSCEEEGEEDSQGEKGAGWVRRKSRRELIFIASSTGGPKALQSVIPKFPKNLDCPVVVVQHMPKGFTRSLADRLNEMSECSVCEAEDGVVLQDGTVYIAKGGYQLGVKPAEKGGHQLVVSRDEPRNGLRPCADVFLESLAESQYQNISCAVLTGMGSDGTKGLLQLKKVKKVYTVGQSEETCVVYGMPRSASENGLVDTMVDLPDVAEYLLKKHI